MVEHQVVDKSEHDSISPSYLYRCIIELMPQVRCKICSSYFYAKPNWLKIGYGKYCSIECRRQSQLKGKFIKCYICGNQAWKMPKALKCSKSGKFFCSKTCQTIWRNSIVFIGPNHSNWKGGHSTYRSRLLREKVPQICKLCGIKDFRLLAAHHIDKNTKNNNIKNLIWLCHNCHYLIHHDIKERQKLMGILV